MDSPEVLDAWIAERKKRFPTSSRIEDKKRKLEDAIASGQLSATLHSNKRQKHGHRFDNHGVHPKTQNRNRKNDRDHVRTTDAGWGGRVRVAPTFPSIAIATNEVSDSSSSTGDDMDREPEVLSSKIQDASEIPVVQEDKEDAETKASQSVVKNNTMGRHRSSALQPKNPPRNPFASRPTLLRNVSHSALSSSTSLILPQFSCSYQKYV